MKKTFLFVFLLAMFVFSCQHEDLKESVNPIPPDHAYLLSDSCRTGNMYQLSMYVGHTSAECQGCVLRNGKLIHVDCMGRGDQCAASAVVSLEIQADSTYNAVVEDITDLTNEDFFLMPARSLCIVAVYGGKSTYLNIPGQMVYRDTATLQFTFTGLYFSEGPAYEND